MRTEPLSLDHQDLLYKPLRAIAESCGHRNVASYIQSGNLVFDRADPDLARGAATLERAILEAAGVSTTVVLRTREELFRIAAKHPFEERASEIKWLAVVFLSGPVDAERRTAFDPAAFTPDEAELDGQELYLHLPAGMARTKLNQAFLDRRLGVPGTTRNWRTVGKLRELLG